MLSGTQWAAVPFMCLLDAMTIFGNILVIVAVFTNRTLRQVQNFLLVSLASADLAVGILVMPLQILVYVDPTRLPRVVCTLFTTLDIFCCTASILNLAAIAVDRYAAIRYPIQYATRRTLATVLAMIASAFGLSGVISIGPVLGFQQGNSSDASQSFNCTLPELPGYIIFSAMGSFYIPAGLIISLYVKIYITLRRRLRRRAQESAVNRFSQATSVRQGSDDRSSACGAVANPTTTSANAATATAAAAAAAAAAAGEAVTANSNNSSINGGGIQDASESIATAAAAAAAAAYQRQLLAGKARARQKISLMRERRALRTLGIVMGVFMLCWLPFFIFYLAGAWGVKQKSAFDAAVWLGYLNSALNPIIYTVFNEDFRRAVARLLRLSGRAEAAVGVVDRGGDGQEMSTLQRLRHRLLG
uniref:G_PROTEIN_RECEP_F1_2 domain-containing protein n=1 Tax=Macrostomum lignano TaxID=282301 RepID=A0A1I8G5D4_9PLAT